MKLLLALAFISSSAFASELAGRWRNTTDGTIINFMKVSGNYRQYNSADYTDQWGRLLYKIDQNVIIPDTGDDHLEGTVTFYDSRGCTFKDLPVVVEFQNERTVNVLMTVPRYKFQTITERRDRYTPPTVRYNCRVLEYVEVPTQLMKF